MVQVVPAVAPLTVVVQVIVDVQADAVVAVVAAEANQL